MSDERLRELERAWLASRGEADLEAYLRARLRAGTLSDSALELAAYLGSEGARSVLGPARALAIKPPKSGVARWLLQLPLPAGPLADELRAHAALAALRHVEVAGHAPLGELGQANLAACAAWLAAAPPREAEQAALLQALGAHEAALSAASPYFRAELPPIANTYEVSREDALEYGVWGLDWDGLTRAIGSALPAGARAARSLRAEVVRALLPLALTVGGPSAAGEEGSEPEPSPGDEVYEALLDRRAWSEEVCQAVRDAAPATKAFKLEQARALIAAFFAAHGFVAKGKRLLSADKQVRATIGARSLRIDLGGPGQWRKPPSLQGRELYLKDFARQLIALAEV